MYVRRVLLITSIPVYGVFDCRDNFILRAADTMCLKLPHSIPDDDAVLLSDILPTAWHANEMGEVKAGDNVAIFGSGPVGILAAHCAFQRGANRVVLIDQEAYRLAFAKAKMPRLEVINFREKAVEDALHEMFQSQDGHYIGPDVCIEAVGFHYANSWLHWAEMTLKLETDPSEILNQLIAVCRKGGRLSIVGVYAGYTNHFNIGGE
jgi:threonine dehydrogenase-like Zn-dependent dehydrogenase